MVGVGGTKAKDFAAATLGLAGLHQYVKRFLFSGRGANPVYDMCVVVLCACSRAILLGGWTWRILDTGAVIAFRASALSAGKERVNRVSFHYKL